MTDIIFIESISDSYRMIPHYLAAEYPSVETISDGFSRRLAEALTQLPEQSRRQQTTVHLYNAFLSYIEEEIRWLHEKTAPTRTMVPIAALTMGWKVSYYSRVDGEPQETTSMILESQRDFLDRISLHGDPRFMVIDGTHPRQMKIESFKRFFSGLWSLLEHSRDEPEFKLAEEYRHKTSVLDAPPTHVDDATIQSWKDAAGFTENQSEGTVVV